METNKFKSNGSARGGRNNTKTVLTAAGLSAAAGMASGAAIVRFGLKNKDNKHEPQVENNVTETVASQDNTPTQQPEKPQQEQQTTQSQHEQVPNSDITTPQPTDSTTGTDDQSSPANDVAVQENPQQHQSYGEDEVDPDLIAQQIAGATETDPNDLDVPDLLTVDGMDIAYGPDGSEFTVAMIRTPDGGQYMLADVDGDGVFSDVFDMNGNYVGVAEGNLTAGDLQEAADPTGGYMAYNGLEPTGEDPSNDIVATEPSASPTNPTDNLIAENRDAPDVEDLLAQLLSSNDDSLAEMTGREMIVDYDAEDTDEDTDDEDDDSESDDLDNDDE